MITDSDREQILSLWKDGLSAAQISDQTGNVRSRNAVIGVIFRARRAGANLPRAVATKGAHKRSASRPIRVPLPREDEPVAVGPVADFPNRGFCQYPRHKDGEAYQACGHHGYPWCAYHASICYAPQRKPGADEG